MAQQRWQGAFPTELGALPLPPTWEKHLQGHLQKANEEQVETVPRVGVRGGTHIPDQDVQEGSDGTDPAAAMSPSSSTSSSSSHQTLQWQWPGSGCTLAPSQPPGAPLLPLGGCPGLSAPPEQDPSPRQIPTPQQHQESSQGANPAQDRQWGRSHTANQELTWVPKPMPQPSRDQPSRDPMAAPHPENSTHDTPSLLGPTWLMSLVHAAFSCLDEATRITVKDEESFGSTTILKSRWSMSCPGVLALEQKTPQSDWESLSHPLSPSKGFSQVIRRVYSGFCGVLAAPGRSGLSKCGSAWFTVNN